MEALALVYKGQYPLYDQLHFDDLVSECSWCELFYVEKENNVDCCSKNCPLAKVGQNCDDNNSWFKWYMIDDVKAAGNIAALAWSEYKRLGG